MFNLICVLLIYLRIVQQKNSLPILTNYNDVLKSTQIIFLIYKYESGFPTFMITSHRLII